MNSCPSRARVQSDPLKHLADPCRGFGVLYLSMKGLQKHLRVAAVVYLVGRSVSWVRVGVVIWYHSYLGFGNLLG